MATHRMYDSLEYRAWARIKTSCYNTKNRSYRTYGARGIKMQNEWRDSFEVFLDDMGKAPLGCTGVELIDYDSDFCRINCRWITRDKRRPLVDMPNQKKRHVYKKYNDPKRITITLEQDFFEYIQRQAIEKSRQKNYPISAAEMIREVLEEAIPMPRQDKFKF